MKKTISFFIVALIINSSLLIDNCICQWVQTNGPFGGNVLSLAVSGNNIFAGTLSNGLFLSTNNGTNWTQTALNNHQVMSLAVSGNNIFAGTNIGVYLSTNNGNNWTQIGLTNQNISSLAVSGNNIFAGVYQFGVYLSTNYGTN